MTGTPITELRDRVAGATKGDLALDAAVHLATGNDPLMGGEASSHDGGRVLWRFTQGMPLSKALQLYPAAAVSAAIFYGVPKYTASLDAVVALCEQKLPGAWWLLGKGRLLPTEPLYGCQFLREGTTDEVIAEGEGPTPALALLSALLTALADEAGR